MRLGEIARFEIGYRLRRASTWFFAVLLIVLPLVVLQALASEPQHLNSPLSTATAIALIAMVGMLVTAAIFGDAATRDADTGMRPLFYTAPLHKLEYLRGRFLGAFACAIDIGSIRRSTAERKTARLWLGAYPTAFEI